MIIITPMIQKRIEPSELDVAMTTVPMLRIRRQSKNKQEDVQSASNVGVKESVQSSQLLRQLFELCFVQAKNKAENNAEGIQDNSTGIGKDISNSGKDSEYFHNNNSQSHDHINETQLLKGAIHIH